MRKLENLDSNHCHPSIECVDFSGNAPVYDRRHGALVPEGLVSQMLELTGLTLGSRILDVGAGTGRTAIPFARTML
jgi:ubiquinone/menaquinone biosynthesis C-methylase UbiE